MKKLLLFLLILFLYFKIKPFGPKKFTKSPDGTFWCRDRVNHPGRQCCKFVSEETITSAKIPGKSKINVINRGYGSECDMNCICKVKEEDCKTQRDCQKDGTGFKCNNKKCQLPCAIDLDCVKRFGNEYGCQKKVCAKLKIIKN